MNKLNKNKVGLALATIVGGLHVVWSLLIAFGWAQSYVDFVFNVHMVKPIVVVNDFNFGLAVALIIIATIIGYVVGYIFATVWNRLHR